MRKIAYKTLLCGIATLSTYAMLSHDYVIVENDTDALIAVGLYRTKSGHKELDFDRKTKTYERLDFQTRELQSVPLAENIVYLLSPGQRTQMPNYSLKAFVDRDLWFSQYPRTLLKTLSAGGRLTEPWEHYKNVGSFVKEVYIGHSRPGSSTGNIEGFSSRKDAFSFPGTERDLKNAIASWLGKEVNVMLTVAEGLSRYQGMQQKSTKTPS